jgi:hypothetical protein
LSDFGAFDGAHDGFALLGAGADVQAAAGGDLDDLAFAQAEPAAQVVVRVWRMIASLPSALLTWPSASAMGRSFES